MRELRDMDLSGLRKLMDELRLTYERRTDQEEMIESIVRSKAIQINDDDPLEESSFDTRANDTMRFYKTNQDNAANLQHAVNMASQKYAIHLQVQVF